MILKNILITGIPRSGTSLFASLIAKNQDAVVFSEPDWLKSIRNISQDSSQFTQNLLLQISQLRLDIEKNKPLALKINRKDGSLPSNYYLRNNHGEVITQKTESKVVLESSAANNPFYIKSNAQFTACIKDLLKSNQFKIVCIIRSPIACIMSWRSLQIPVSSGNMKIAEKYSLSFKEMISQKVSILSKQVAIIDWFYKSFHEYSKYIELVKYEELISDTSNVIKRITLSEPTSIPELNSKNSSKHYDLDEEALILSCLSKEGKYYKLFYPQLGLSSDY